MPWWVSSSGEDGVVKVWDLRCGARALATLEEHAGAVHRIAWSPSHTEFLASCSSDRRFKLWSLNLPPHYVVLSKQAEYSVVGAGFLKPAMFHTCAVTQGGDIMLAKLGDQFIDPLVPQREGGSEVAQASDDIAQEREVAKLIYFRNLAVAFDKALALAEKLSLQHK